MFSYNHKREEYKLISWDSCFSIIFQRGVMYSIKVILQVLVLVVVSPLVYYVVPASILTHLIPIVLGLGLVGYGMEQATKDAKNELALHDLCVTILVASVRQTTKV